MNFIFQLVLLEEDRWIEFHVQYGNYFRLRIPKFGRDISYHEPSADLYIVGSGYIKVFSFDLITVSFLLHETHLKNFLFCLKFFAKATFCIFSPDAYRVNLEQGRFMTPCTTKATSLTKCDVNPEHHLMIFGTWEVRLVDLIFN